MLGAGEVVLPSDEFIDDDCQHWLPAERWTIGRPWHDGLKPMRRAMTVTLPLPVAAYALPDGALLERCGQADGSFLWAIRRTGSVLSTDGQWEFEPMPSGRDAEFLARCRYASAELAFEVWRRYNVSSLR
jgi:hypothetical protein